MDLSLALIQQGGITVTDSNLLCIRYSNNISVKFCSSYYLSRNKFLIKNKFPIVSNYDLIIYQCKFLLKAIRISILSKNILSIKYFFLGVYSGVKAGFYKLSRYF